MKGELRRSCVIILMGSLWRLVNNKQTLFRPVMYSSHFLDAEPHKFLCKLPLFSHRWQSLTAVVLSLSLLWLNTAWLPTSPFPTAFLFLQLWPPTLFLDLLPSTLILLACSLCPIFPSFLSCCLRLLHSSVSLFHSLLPSSARLYQGLGKLSHVSTGCLFKS